MSREETQPFVENAFVATVQAEQTKEKKINELEKKVVKLQEKMNILPLSVFICVLSYFGLFLWLYFTKPADCTIVINSIQSRFNLLESELKLDNNIIPRVLWADDELKPNTTDLKPLSLPVIGVIAHHTGNIENRCFTIGEFHNHNYDSW